MRDEIFVTTFSHTGASVLLGLACFLVVGTLTSHLVKEKDSCSTTKYLRDSPLPMLVVVFFVPIN